jgi:hypothetical protein
MDEWVQRVSHLAGQDLVRAGCVVHFRPQGDGRALIACTRPQIVDGRQSRLTHFLVAPPGILETGGEPVEMALGLPQSPVLPVGDDLPQLDGRQLLEAGRESCRDMMTVLDDPDSREAVLKVFACKSSQPYRVVVCQAPALQFRALPQLANLICRALPPSDLQRGFTTLFPSKEEALPGLQTYDFVFVGDAQAVRAIEPPQDGAAQLFLRGFLREILSEPSLRSRLSGIRRQVSSLAETSSGTWARWSLRMMLSRRAAGSVATIIDSYVRTGSALGEFLTGHDLRRAATLLAEAGDERTLKALIEALRGQVRQCRALLLWVWELAEIVSGKPPLLKDVAEALENLTKPEEVRK